MKGITCLSSPDRFYLLTSTTQGDGLEDLVSVPNYLAMATNFAEEHGSDFCSQLTVNRSGALNIQGERAEDALLRDAGTNWVLLRDVTVLSNSTPKYFCVRWPRPPGLVGVVIGSRRHSLVDAPVMSRVITNVVLIWRVTGERGS